MKNHLVKKYAGIIIVIILCSCNNETVIQENSKNNIVTKHDFTNKPVYNITVGDTLKVYHQTGQTTRFFKVQILDRLRHLELLEDRIVIPAKSLHCEGCTSTHALVFIARSAGTDTIFNQKKDALGHNDDTTVHVSHIIHIR